MTLFAHAVSASIISLKLAGVDPSQTTYLWLAIGVPAALDLDHLVLLYTRRKIFQKEGMKGNLHKARSFMHEMLGVLIVGIFSLLVLMFDRKMSTVIFFAYLIHVIEDMIMGIAIPFYPVSKMECRLFKFSLKEKAAVEICVIIISLFLWVNYLKG